MPKVTVVIPAYNAMTYLPQTLDSVLKQTFTDFEVLIINDGSKDNIIQWASEITDARVKLISQENQGLPGALNTGIVHAQGERIAFHYPFVVVKEPLTLYRQYSHSMSKNRQRMFQNLRTVVEKAFQTVPLEMLPIRNSAYASITLNQAWWSVDEGDYRTARTWQKQAYLHSPPIQYSEKYRTPI